MLAKIIYPALHHPEALILASFLTSCSRFGLSTASVHLLLPCFRTSDPFHFEPETFSSETTARWLFISGVIIERRLGTLTAPAGEIWKCTGLGYYYDHHTRTYTACFFLYADIFHMRQSLEVDLLLVLLRQPSAWALQLYRIWRSYEQALTQLHEDFTTWIFFVSWWEKRTGLDCQNEWT